MDRNADSYLASQASLISIEDECYSSDVEAQNQEDIDKEAEDNSTSLLLSTKLMRGNHECVLLSKQIFEKSQLLKVL